MTVTASMVTLHDGYFYVPVKVTVKSIQVLCYRTNDYLEGDQNHDGVVDTEDIGLVNYYYGKSEDDYPDWDYRADVCPDRVCDSTDTAIVSYNNGHTGTWSTDVNTLTVHWSTGKVDNVPADGKLNIPSGATYFYVKKNGVGVHAAVDFHDTEVPSAGWLTGWSYRKSHVINPASGAGANYPVQVIVHYHPYVFSSAWNSGVIATGTAADVARNVLIDGNYLYAVSQTAKKFVIYDISDPDSPVLKSSTSTDYGNIDVRKKGNYLFVSCGNGVEVWNVSNPTAPVKVTTIFNDGYFVHGMFLDGNYLYCCRHEMDRFVIVDVTDPTNPIVKGYLSGATYFNGVHDVYVEGNYAYITNYEATTGQYGFVIVDVSNKDSPQLVGYTGEGHKNSHIWKIGNYCYVGTHSPDSGLRVYDVSNPASPSYVGAFFTEEGVSFGYWIAQYGSDKLAAICQGSDKLYLIDVSTPNTPKILTWISTTERPKNVAVNGDRFYVSTEDGSLNWRLRSYLLSLMEDSGQNVCLNGKCLTDFGDVRFTDDDGSTLLSYWMESKVDGDYAVFWVKINDDLSENNATIYVYYGNNEAQYDGDITQVFTDADEFNSLSENWTIDVHDSNYENITVENGVLKITGRRHAYRHIQKSSPNLSSFSLQFKAQGVSDEISWAIAVGIYFGTYNYARVVMRLESSYQFHYDIDGSPDAVSAGSCSGWKYGRLRVTSSKVYGDYSEDGITWTNIGSIDRPANWTTPQLVIIGHGYEVNSGSYPNPDWDNSYSAPESVGTSYADKYFFRKYVSPEPAHGSWGNEEELGVYVISVDAVSQPLATSAYETTYNISREASVASQGLTASEATFTIPKDAVVDVLANMLIEVVTGIIEIFKEAITTAQALCQTETAFSITQEALAEALTQTLFELGISKNATVKASSSSAFEVAFTLPLNAIVKADAPSTLESTFHISQDASIKVLAEVAVLKPTEVKVTRLFLVMGDLAIQIQGL